MREYNVALKQGVDYDGFWNDMESDTDGGKLYIPNRAVQYTNERPASLRQCWYLLTDEEAETLRQDDRVYCVEIPPEHRDDIFIAHSATQTEDFSKTTSTSGAYVNWGLVRSSNSYNIYGLSTASTGSYTYSLDGTGVDVVIQDSGLQVDHPEFQDGSGVSRVQQINWPAASGLGFTQNANHYRDYDGHGTHVAGIAAGKKYGWAKNARIYSVKLNGLEGSGDSGTGISVTYAFDCIKGWHTAKAGSRPTVVNMSWGYLTYYNSITSVNYRGTSYTDASTTGNATYRQNTYGIRNLSGAAYGYNYICNVRVSSVDVDVEEMISAGIVVCIAAGNRSFKIDTSSGTDYNNNMVTDTGTIYYHRGSSPSSPNAIIVGNVDNSPLSITQDRKATSSEAGPGVDIYAPGTYIMSSCSTTTRFTTGDYYGGIVGSAYRQTNISGTSMASPQVTGVAALVAQKYPSYTPAQIKAALLAQATATLYSSGLDNDWTSSRSLLGSVNRMLFANFQLDAATTTTTTTAGPTTTSTSTTSTTSTSTSTTSTTTSALPTSTTTSTSTSSTSTSTSTTSTTTTTTLAPIICTSYMCSSTKGGYVYWYDCETNNPASTFIGPGKRKYISSRTIPSVEKNSKIKIEAQDTYILGFFDIEPLP